MPTKPTMLSCRDCRVRFPEKPPNSRGFRNQCPECSENQDEPELVGGNMIYEQKTGGYVELKPLHQAQQFARRTRRLGAGVTASLCPKKGFSPAE